MEIEIGGYGELGSPSLSDEIARCITTQYNANGRSNIVCAVQKIEWIPPSVDLPTCTASEAHSGLAAKPATGV